MVGTLNYIKEHYSKIFSFFIFLNELCLCVGLYTKVQVSVETEEVVDILKIQL